MATDRYKPAVLEGNIVAMVEHKQRLFIATSTAVYEVDGQLLKPVEFLVEVPLTDEQKSIIEWQTR